MAISACARSTTSGSRAAFSMTVSPSARQAAIIRFSVPVTVTMSVTMRAPLSRLARATTKPASMSICAPIACRPLICWSTGRWPMAQPPGSDTLASPKRASSGPSTRMEARMVLTSSYGASVPDRLSACRVSRSPSRSHFTPSSVSSRMVVAMSRRFGTLDSASVSPVSRLAHRMGRAAFLAPAACTSPTRGVPPVIFSLSMVSLSGWSV